MRNRRLALAAALLLAITSADGAALAVSGADFSSEEVAEAVFDEVENEGLDNQDEVQEQVQTPEMDQVEEQSSEDSFSDASGMEAAAEWQNEEAATADEALVFSDGEDTGITYTLSDDGKLVISGTGSIADDAFAGNTKITSVVISEGVTGIGSGAFTGCTNLTSVTIPEGVTTIDGMTFGTVETNEATENSLTEMMVGKKVELNIARSAPVNPVKRLSVSHLTVYNREEIKVLDDVSFDVFGGEVLGIAGISGNGQKELLEAIAGLQITAQGSSIEFYEKGKEDQPLQLVGKTPKKIRDAGVHLAFVPEDRLGMGLVGSMGMTGNMLLKSYGNGPSPITDMRAPKKMAEKVKKELEVVTPSLNTPVSRLSGGNVQKVLVGREIAEAPTVLMTAYAVRGLDINTSYTIYNLLNEEKKEGVAVVYVGEDLDVLIDLCDRILVLCGGRENGVLDARTTTKEEVGLLMTNLRKEGK